MSDLEKLKLHLRRFQNGVAEYPNRTISMIEELEKAICIYVRQEGERYGWVVTDGEAVEWFISEHQEGE